MADKTYNGPYGSYKAGCAGAVLNAACRQEGKSTVFMDDLVVGNGKLMKRSNESTVVATFVWDGDNITFNWS